MILEHWIHQTLEVISARDGLDFDAVRAEMQRGTHVLLCGRARGSSNPSSAVLVGPLAPARICALVGATSPGDDPTAHLTALDAAGADCIMDLSTVAEALEFRRALRAHWAKPLGVCLTYDLFSRRRDPYTRDSFRAAVREALRCDPDFVLVHAGVSRRLMTLAAASTRVMPTTSRGGGLVWAYMARTAAENPLLDFFDVLVEEVSEIGAVLDLGDVFRPGCTADAGDALKEEELQLLATLRTTAMGHAVQVLCESGGHMSLGDIARLIPSYKGILGGAPLWLAGPLPTDRAITLDAVANAIGVAIAAQSGGDMFATITNVEHYAMPSAKDTAESARYLRVALDAVALSRGDRAVAEANRRVSAARRRNDWAEQAAGAIFPAIARNAFLDAALDTSGKPCTICGSLCPHVKTGGTPLRTTAPAPEERY